MTPFYNAVLESVVRYTFGQSKIERELSTASKVNGNKLKSLNSIYDKAVIAQAQRIRNDDRHILHSEYATLPCGRCYICQTQIKSAHVLSPFFYHSAEHTAHFMLPDFYFPESPYLILPYLDMTYSQTGFCLVNVLIITPGICNSLFLLIFKCTGLLQFICIFSPFPWIFIHFLILISVSLRF